jgi:hypothetical protein
MVRADPSRCLLCALVPLTVSECHMRVEWMVRQQCGMEGEVSGRRRHREEEGLAPQHANMTMASALQRQHTDATIGKEENGDQTKWKGEGRGRERERQSEGRSEGEIRRPSDVADGLQVNECAA